MVSEEPDSLDLDAMFPEPERPPTPEPTFSIYKREASFDSDWQEISIRLVGGHPLWGHYLWNSALALASYLDQAPNVSLYRDRNVLELGAGGALPSIVVAKNGASRVVVTDYPDCQLIENIEYNVEKNVSGAASTKIAVRGYIWGQPVDPLLDCIDSFHLIILSDLLFNHSEHDAILKTCRSCLSSDPAPGSVQPAVLVFYSHHRPHLAHRDMGFFAKAQADGWFCEEVLRRKFPPMFPDDPGEEEIRSTVHGWRLTRGLS